MQGRYLIEGIRPTVAIKAAECDAAPFQVIGAARVAVNLNMHDNGIGLLNLADLAELYSVAEAGRQVAGGCVRTQVAGRNTRQKEKNE